jgi:transposase
VDIWQLTDEEWARVGPLLAAQGDEGGSAGRPRLDNDRQAAEACLFRHYRSLCNRYRCFGWNRLPKEMGISPSTANRRFREWSANGRWVRFWQALLELRRSPAPQPWHVDRTHGQFPVGDILVELERAYLFFNDRFFGGVLPPEVALSLEQRKARRCRGYFCARLWHDSERDLGYIAIHTSVLNGAAEGALAVLLHEMVHLRNDHFHIADCHPVNQYHNRHFRDAATLAGLECAARHETYGYAFTHLNADGRQAVAELGPDESLFRWSVVTAR